MNTTSTEILNKNFLVSGRLIFTAPGNILKYITDSDRIYVLVDNTHLGSDRNVFSYDMNGSLLWQVDEIDKLHSRNYFTSIYIKSNDLYAYNINGLEAVIDKLTGKILDKTLIR
jgi:hypothetical protein